jgi:branched-chain amino acid transport system permease protein
MATPAVRARRALDTGAPLIFGVTVTGAVTVACSFGPQSLQDTLVAGLINLILVLGLYVFVGNSGVLSFGHAAIMAVGGYVTAILMMPVLFKPDVIPGLPDFLLESELRALPATFVGGLVAAAFAAIVAVPLVRVNGLQAGLATVALLLVVRTVLQNWTGVTGGSQGLAPVPVSSSAPTTFLWACGALVAAFAFQRSRFGLRLRASREDEIAAVGVGVRVRRERAVALVISGFITGVGGALFVQSVGIADPNAFYIGTTFLVVTMLVVGGMTTLTGAVLGTLLISVISRFMLQVEEGSVLGIVDVGRAPGIRDVVLSLVMLGVLLLRPAGLTGGKEFSWPRRGR